MSDRQTESNAYLKSTNTQYNLLILTYNFNKTVYNEKVVRGRVTFTKTRLTARHHVMRLSKNI